MTNLDFLELAKRSPAELFAAASHFEPERLQGYVYRGISLGLPRIVRAVTWTKFAKSFDHRAGGDNIRIIDDDLSNPWRPRLRSGKPWRFGPFAVVRSPDSVELDYHNNGFPLRALRDPLLSLDAQATLLIGCTQLAVAGRMLRTPSHFLLQRDLELTALLSR